MTRVTHRDLLLDGWREMLCRTEANRPLIVASLEAMVQIARSPELRERMAAAYDACRVKIAEVVQESLPNESGADANVIASFVIAVVDGITLQQMADPERAPTGDQLGESLSRAVFREPRDRGSAARDARGARP